MSFKSLCFVLSLASLSLLFQSDVFGLCTTDCRPIVPEKERTSLTGDWGGARTKLKNQGATITCTYGNDLLGNPIGGEHRGFAYADSTGLNLTLDLEKIAKIKGLEFFTSFVYRSGNNLSQERIGNQFPVAQLYGSETYRLCSLLLRETLFDGALMLKVGRMSGGDDFLASPLYCQFVNNAFCGNPISPFFSVPFTAYPNATWGAYMRIRPHPGVHLKFAIYNANSKIQANKYHGTNFTFDSTQGAFLITEWKYLNNQPEQSHGHPGNYSLGYYYVTGQAPLFEGGSQKGNYCYYLLVDQQIYRHKTQGAMQTITPFAALLFAPKNRNRFPYFMTAGLIFDAPIASRKEDSLSLGIAYGLYSSDLRSAQRFAKRTGIIGPYGNRQEAFETVLEANYWIQVSKWLALTPDVQYIINPKGFGTIPNALVIGMQISANL